MGPLDKHLLTLGRALTADQRREPVRSVGEGLHMGAWMVTELISEKAYPPSTWGPFMIADAPMARRQLGDP